MATWAQQNARKLDKARTLLHPGLNEAGGIWADLGCGDGVFTYLLCTHLPPGSQIYAVDKNERALQALKRNLSDHCSRVLLHTLPANFTRPLSLTPLDGLVMANSLHFIRHKKPVLAHLAGLLKPGGRLLIVEYNTNRGNYAVPHPLDESAFMALAGQVGLQQAQIVSRAPSTFLGQMYTGMALAAKNADG